MNLRTEIGADGIIRNVDTFKQAGTFAASPHAYNIYQFLYFIFIHEAQRRLVRLILRPHLGAP